jgi:hypothetical protein
LALDLRPHDANKPMWSSCARLQPIAAVLDWRKQRSLPMTHLLGANDTDVIDLWARLRGLPLRDAALDLVHTFGLEPAPRTEKRNG